jgi:leucyl aminopeptidase
MHASATTDAPAATQADTIAIGVFDDEGVAHDLDGEPLGALLEAGEARTSFRHLALHRADGRRWLLVGLGSRERFDAERARVAAAAVHSRARELGTRTLCWELPHHVPDAVAGALVEGTILASYRFDRYRARPEDDPPRDLDEVIVSAHHDVADAVHRGAVGADAQNFARELQDTPANDLTPTALAERAAEIAGVEVEVHGRDWMTEQGMGALLAVAQGSDHEPALIVARYDGGDGPLVGLVGKAVTHDTGGLSIKPAGSMHEMKFDMSGGAAVLEATAAIARLGLPVTLTSIVPATENMPSGTAVKPGDIVTAMNGKTIEVNNTDAEGRLILADSLCLAVEEGAERLLDIATLTGAVLFALGHTYAGLWSNDDDWFEQVREASDATGELGWRMPLHPEYLELTKGTFADLQNAAEARVAQSNYAAEFLRQFVDDRPWIHVDIAGMAWALTRNYVGKGASGFGTRMLIELARRSAA